MHDPQTSSISQTHHIIDSIHSNIENIENIATKPAENRSGHLLTHVAEGVNNTGAAEQDGLPTDDTDTNINRALHFAAINNSTEALKFLLEHGASVNYKNADGESPIHLAAAWNSVESIKLLLHHGALVRTRATDIYTPFQYAASRGQIEAMELLLQHGAYVGEKGSDDRTAIFWL